MHKGKKVGYGLLSLLPLLLMLLLQILSVQIIFAAITVYVSMQPGTNPSLIEEIVHAYYTEHTVGVLVFAQTITLLIFGCWYYLGLIRGKARAVSTKTISFYSITGTLLLAPGLYFLLSLLLEAANHLVPDIMAKYNTLIENSSIGSLSLLSALATLVLAPLSEELIFRGLTIHYLRKTGIAFWAANVLQAALFGIAHMNLVQGIYAFLLGIVLGCLRKYFNSLVIPMLFHTLFNFSGTFLSYLMDSLSGTLWFYLFQAAAFVLLTISGVMLLMKASLQLNKKA